MATKKKASKKTAKKKSAKKKPVRKKPTKKKPVRKAAPRKKAPAKRKAPGKRKASPKKKAAPRKKAAAKRQAPARKKRPVRGHRGAAFFEHFRQRLLSERGQITGRLDELREELRGLDETPREIEEWAQEEKDRDILIRLEERETEELRRIQAALMLIDAREYGKCQVCGRPIPRARLEELPTAFRCVEHTP